MGLLKRCTLIERSDQSPTAEQTYCTSPEIAVVAVDYFDVRGLDVLFALAFYEQRPFVSSIRYT